MALSPRMRGVLRYVGYVILALVTFVFALHLTFPYERVRDRALEALQTKYDVTIDGVDRSLVPGRFALTGVTLRSRPSVAGQPSTTMYFKRIEIDLAFAPLLSGKVQIGLDITTNKGNITGSIVQAKHETSYAFNLNKVPLTMIPGVSDAVGLPMYGNADGKVRLKLVKNDWSKANGVFELACTVGCTIGNDSTCAAGGDGHCVDLAQITSGFNTGTICVDRCVSDTDCRQGEGYRCVDGGGTIGKYCRHPQIGDTCTMDAQCDDAVGMRCGFSLPGGFCTIRQPCPTPGSSLGCAPLSSICWDGPTPADLNFCVDRCGGPENTQGGCRTGLTCRDVDPQGGPTHVFLGCVQ